MKIRGLKKKIRDHKKSVTDAFICGFSVGLISFTVVDHDKSKRNMKIQGGDGFKMTQRPPHFVLQFFSLQLDLEGLM